MKENNQLIWKAAAWFFGAMILLTLVSRAIYQHGIAVVSTERPTAGAIAHSVQAAGKTVQNQDLAVTTVGGLRVGSVQVNEGQQVKEGDLLFTLDLDFLDEAILRQKQEMKKQKLTISDAWSMASASQKQRENQKAQAQENYDSAVSRAETMCNRAQRDLERAEKALEDFRNGAQGDKAEEQSLIAACEDAQEALNTAKARLESLNQEMEAEIARRQAEAEQGTIPPVPDPTLPPTVPAEPETEPNMPETIPTVPETSPTVSETETPTEEIPALPLEPTVAPEETESFVEPLPETEPVLLPEPIPSKPSALRGFFTRELSQAEKNQIANAVRAEYAIRISQAEAQVRDAEFTYQQAQEELADYHRDQQSPKTEADLIAAVEQAQEAYDDAVTALENAEIAGNRGIQSAALPNPTGSAGAIGQITYEQMELDLQKLEALREAEGKVLAPADGIITESHVKTGNMTTDTTAMLMVDLSKGCRFNCQITKDDSKYIGVGDKVTLKASGNGKQYKDLPVTTLAQSKEDEDLYDLTVQLPPDTLRYGASADLSFTKKSRAYDCCVPIQALHMDAHNNAYVLVIETTDSILGRGLTAKKIGVKVLEKNNMLAALEVGSVSQSQQLIVGADRFVDTGSRVRVE